LALEFVLQLVNFSEKTLDLSLNFEGYTAQLYVVFVAEFALVDALDQSLAVF